MSQKDQGELNSAQERKTKEDQGELNLAQENDQASEKPRLKPIIEGAESLSLGISMVVAVLLGVGIGLLLRSLTGVGWTLWIGVFIGIAGAVLNVFKAYSKQYKEFEKLAKEPRYAIKRKLEEEDEVDADGVDKSY